MRRLNAVVLPVAGDGLARHAQPRHDVGELAVAVRRLVEVHEVHVDAAVGQVATELGVQVQERLLQRLQPGDPHLGRREGVHPADDPDAGVVGAGVQAGAPDAVGVVTVGLWTISTGIRRSLEAGHDVRRLLGDVAQRLFAVEVLAARQEPDPKPVKCHSELPPLDPSRAQPI